MERISESGSCIRCGNATTEKGRIVRKFSGIREVYFCSACNKTGGVEGNGKGIGMVDDVFSHRVEQANAGCSPENRRKDGVSMDAQSDIEATSRSDINVYYKG